MWKKSGAPSLADMEQHILGAVLRLGDDAYGLRIQEEIGRRTSKPVSLSGIYAALTRLEAKGFLRSQLGDPSPHRGGRRKRLYKVAAAGRAALGANIRSIKALAGDLEALVRGAR